jgi:hypothetical protein
MEELQRDLYEGLDRNIIDTNAHREFILPAKTVWNISGRMFEAVTGPRGERIPQSRDMTSESWFVIQVKVY